MAATVVKVLGRTSNGLIEITNGVKTISIPREELSTKIKENKIVIANSIKIKCLKKQRDKNNNIIAYLVQDRSGNKKVFSAKELKAAIYDFRFDCINLTLTSDGRLVDTTPTNTEPKSTKSQALAPKKAPKETPNVVAKQSKNTPINDYVMTLEILNKVFNFIEEDIKAYYKDSKAENTETFSETDSFLSIIDKSIKVEIYFISRGTRFNLSSVKGAKQIPETKLSLVSDFSVVNNSKYTYRATVLCSNPNDNLKLPSSCRELITNSLKYRVEILILDGLDWSDVETTEKMFYISKCSHIRIINSEAPKLKNMYGMFKRSDIESADLSSFKVPNVERTTAMFCRCPKFEPHRTSLSGLSFKNVKYAGMMFYSHDPYPNIDILINQCKRLGWNGYPDGREDDIAETLSLPIQYYPEEQFNKKHSNKKRKTAPVIINYDAIDAIRKAYNI